MGDMSVSAGGSGGQVVPALTTSSAGVTIHPWHHLQPTAPVYSGKLLPSITSPSLLQLNTIHIQVSLGASQRPVCRSALDSTSVSHLIDTAKAGCGSTF